MTQIQDLTKKIADFFTGEDFYENGERATLTLSVEDVRCVLALIKSKKSSCGRWVYVGNGHNGLHECSKCGARRKMFDSLEHYCPNCGIRMIV